MSEPSIKDEDKLRFSEPLLGRCVNCSTSSIDCKPGASVRSIYRRNRRGSWAVANYSRSLRLTKVRSSFRVLEDRVFGSMRREPRLSICAHI